MSNLFLLSISSDNKIEKYLKKDQDNFSSSINITETTTLSDGKIMVK